MKRGSDLFFWLFGLLAGIGLGILYAWMLVPVEYVDTSPVSLRTDLKNEYRELIALAYQANGDTARAQARLQLLQDGDVANTLAAQAQRANADGEPIEIVRALAQLASVAEAPPSDVPTAIPLTLFPTLTASPTDPDPDTPMPAATSTITPTETLRPTFTPTITPTPDGSEEPGDSADATVTATPAPSRTPTPMPTFTASPTPTATPGNPFILDSQALVCRTDVQGPLLIVQALDINGRGVPGVEIVINWEEEEEHFFTGLKPELGLGYADFRMASEVLYTLRLADGSQLIPNLAAQRCTTDDGREIWGTLELRFVQP